MAEPAIPTATPSANDPNGGNPVITPAVTPGNNPAPASKPGEFILSQEQFDKRWGEKMTTLEGELGMPLKEVKAFLEANKKPKAVPAGETLSGADLKIAKMEALMTAGVPSKQIPLLLQYLNISGKTREELDASIQGLITAKLLVIDVPTTPAATPGNEPTKPPIKGAGNPGLPNDGGQKKVWTEKEIKELRNSGKMTDDLHKEIMKASAEGRVQ